MSRIFKTVFLWFLIFLCVNLVHSRCYRLGDLNLDGKVGFEDVKILSEYWLVQDDVEVGLTAYWKLDDSFGNVVSDSSGFGYDGSIVENPGWTKGFAGYALNFYGNGDSIDIPDFDLSGDWTISFWVKAGLDNPGNTNGSMVLGNGFDILNYFSVVDGLQVKFVNSSGSSVIWDSDTDFYDQWRQVTLVGKSSSVELFLDGVSQGSKSITSTLKFYHIGTGHWVSSYDFEGTIDDVRLYACALTATQINEISPSIFDFVNIDDVGSVDLLDFANLAVNWQERGYPYRWVYYLTNFNTSSDVTQIQNVIQTAAAHGLNGIALNARLDRMDQQPPEFFDRLEAVKQTSQDYNIEIIPVIFSVSSGGGIFNDNINLAPGLPVYEALFVEQDGYAHLVQDHFLEIANGDFEAYTGNQFDSFSQDLPGQISFVDTSVYKSGNSSIRFENFHLSPYGHGRIFQNFSVHPHRCYKVTFWVKTENLSPSSSFRMFIHNTAIDRQLLYWNPGIAATTGWTKITAGFNSLEYNTLNFGIGVWGAESGKFWVDDIQIQEIGLTNVLRRPGTPITVKNASTEEIYIEGVDYGYIDDPGKNYWYEFDHPEPLIEIFSDGSISDGELLRVSYYHGMALSKGWVGLCMSEPELYELWETKLALIEQHLSPKKYFLNIDEIRQGGSCNACKSRGISMGEILGDCVTKQVDMIRAINPQAEIFIWSDMFDPYHNCHDDYYIVDGDFTGAWNHIPKDLHMIAWQYEIRNETLPFFSSLNFKTLGAAYYDCGDLSNPIDWLKSLDDTLNTWGIMYTTWCNDYSMLADFGDLVKDAGVEE